MAYIKIKVEDHMAMFTELPRIVASGSQNTDGLQIEVGCTTPLTKERL